MVKKDFTDKPLKCINAFIVFFIIALLSFISFGAIYNGNSIIMFPAMMIIFLLILAFPSSIFINSPNEAKVVEFFGNYIGTLVNSGFFFSIPFANRRTISLKVNNINTDVIKVNDLNGNPIEISAVIVWQVVCPVKACLNVMDYKEFIAIQSETALRELASSYAYDNYDVSKESLQKNSKRVSLKLQEILQVRLEIAGINIEDAKISHLAYSSEIAKAMLKRQQAQAIIAARIHIVKNAVSMVEEVLAHFESSNTVEFSIQQKFNLINNLLVSLLSEQGVQPTINIE